jgi:cysteine synthase
MSAFSTNLQERISGLPEAKSAPRPEIDAALRDLIGQTRMKFLPVEKGGIALAMLTDNPASTHYDEVFASLIQILEGRDERYQQYKEKPRLGPSMTKTLLETSSGSAGPSVAWISRAYGYEPLVVIPQGMQAAYPGRYDAHIQTLGNPLALPSSGERADAVIRHAMEGKGGLIESWHGDYQTGSHMTGMVKSVAEIHQAWQVAGKPPEPFFLNHSRRAEAPVAFAGATQRLIEQANKELGVDFDLFVGALGNGTTIEGARLALRERYGNACRIHAFTAKNNLPGTSNLDGIAMPNIKEEGYDESSVLDPLLWDETAAKGTDDPRLYNIGKSLRDTVGMTTIAAMGIARDTILAGRAQYALVLAYDKRDRYESIIDDQNAVYAGQGKWE